MLVNNNKLRVGVIGATGYAGAELVRLLASHPFVEITLLTSHSSAGKPAHDPAPQLRGLPLPLLEPFDAASLRGRAELVFSAQESGFAMKTAEAILESGCRLVDLSADFRLADPALYPEWYKMEHSAPGLLGEALFGLPELNGRQGYGAARIVANPGCYPTAAGLAVAPLVKAGIVSGPIVIDSKSGVSGAGRSKTTVEYLYSELNDSFKAYNPVKHRHVPEIEQILGRAGGGNVLVRFTPHLTPMTRGIFTTAHVPVSRTEGLEELYHAMYGNEPFVQVLPEGTIPSTKHVAGSNQAHVSVTVDRRTGYAVCFSVIDNLVKGAAGQAVQNMNLMFGLEETAGLPLSGLYP